MSTTVNVYRKTGERVVMPLDNKRGTIGIWLVIATEAVWVFVVVILYLIPNWIVYGH